VRFTVAGTRKSWTYALVRITPRVVDILATYAPRIGNVFPDRRPPREIKFGIGDTVSVTIFEAAAGGLFIPIEAGVRPGNFVSLPNQNVDTQGNALCPTLARSERPGGPHLKSNRRS
jgi:polysaccharide biosynthesis/export protein